jgi:hypothetical protein
MKRLRAEEQRLGFMSATTQRLLGEAADEIERLRAGLQRIVEGDGFWDAPALARDLLEGKEKL